MTTSNTAAMTNTTIPPSGDCIPEILSEDRIILRLKKVVGDGVVGNVKIVKTLSTPSFTSLVPTGFEKTLAPHSKGSAPAACRSSTSLFTSSDKSLTTHHYQPRDDTSSLRAIVPIPLLNLHHHNTAGGGGGRRRRALAGGATCSVPTPTAI